MVDCRNDDHYGKGLFVVDKEEFVDNNLVDSKQALTFDEEKECEEYVKGDEGPLLVMRWAFFTSHIYKSEGMTGIATIRLGLTCACLFVIDSGSCKIIIFWKAIQKMWLETEKYHHPYKLAEIKK